MTSADTVRDSRCWCAWHYRIEWPLMTVLREYEDFYNTAGLTAP
jgi:hypothetical protein